MNSKKLEGIVALNFVALGLLIAFVVLYVAWGVGLRLTTGKKIRKRLRAMGLRPDSALQESLQKHFAATRDLTMLTRKLEIGRLLVLNGAVTVAWGFDDALYSKYAASPTLIIAVPRPSCVLPWNMGNNIRGGGPSGGRTKGARKLDGIAVEWMDEGARHQVPPGAASCFRSAKRTRSQAVTLWTSGTLHLVGGGGWISLRWKSISNPARELDLLIQIGQDLANLA